MDLALSLGRRNQGKTWPNPSVGCVIVQKVRVVGRGWTQAGGRPHAETMALQQAAGAAQGATAYVTLEPCAHVGKTPSCAQALITAGVARVVTSMTDPDTRTGGQGHAMLREAAIDVHENCRTDHAAGDHAGFILRLAKNRPFVTLKLATSFDGRIATASGESRWITGAGARAHVHAMRDRHDAVMIGVGTAVADDPMLDVRTMGLRQQPVRVVCDSGLRLPIAGRLAQSAGDQQLWLCHGVQASKAKREALKQRGVQLLECATNAGGRLDIVDVLRQLAQRGLNRVFCEGGGALAGSLLNANMVDQLLGYTAGLTLGSDGLPSIGPLDGADLSAMPRFELAHNRRVGGDTLSVWRRR